MNFTEITKMMNEQFTKTGKKPVEIKVNPEWFEKQLQQSFTLRKANENPLTSLTGLPVHEDDTIDTFKFVYREVNNDK